MWVAVLALPWLPVQVVEGQAEAWLELVEVPCHWCTGLGELIVLAQTWRTFLMMYYLTV